MGLLTIIRKNRMKEKEMRILFLGLDNAGKTTILKKLNGEDIKSVSPTLGFNIKTFMHGSSRTILEDSYLAGDVGGQRTLRPYWRNYFEQTDALVWVVDSGDRMRMKDCKEELHSLLLEDRLAGASLLIFANKRDLPGSMSEDEIRKVLDLDSSSPTIGQFGLAAQSQERTSSKVLTGLSMMSPIDCIIHPQCPGTVLPHQIQASRQFHEPIKARLADGAKASWELGTRAEALLEHDAPEFSVFGSQVPPPQSIPDELQTAVDPVISIARNVLSNRAQSNNNARGPQPFMQDGSAADPASIGVAVLLANWTRQGGNDYAGAAKDQLDFLYQSVPRASDGALSHRVDSVQLWSDFVYMLPPFLANYGVLTQNESLISDAYQQIKLYRDNLRDTKANNLWKHIVTPNGGGGSDNGHWSTGNGWAAAGMLRVLATIQNSQYSEDFKDEQDDLTNWVSEIHGGMYPHLGSTNIFTNYADDTGSFHDCSSTALLAATVYRLSLLRDVHHFLPKAEASRKALYATSSNGSLQHFTQDGWLTPVVNPHSFGKEGADSPEGQAFVLEMDAAWKAWVADGSKGANSVSGFKHLPVSTTAFAALMVLVLACMVS
ncbi:hypothetical protein VNI00_004999 [Paramarasmius palmivorus]|uniref:ADP-ribosylation factor n=1 Tax=Paramarasmius palmivorus TaxID=297713 RepID=A0AAW0DI88_9AGAR